MAQTPDPGPRAPRRGVGAGVALIFMTPLVLVLGVFFAYAGAVECGNNTLGVKCQAGPGAGYGIAVVLPAVLGIVALVARRRWPRAPAICWVIAVVVVPLLIFIR